MARLIQKANSKLGSNTVMFNIPASMEVCGRICKNCYAHKFYKIYPNVLPAQELRLEASKRDDFVQVVNGEISRLRNTPKYFRIHGSAGEFYSQRYIQKWVAIVKANPSLQFYAYTKRLKEFDFSELKALGNIVLIDSFHYGAINFGTKEEAPKDAFICPHQKGADVQCGIDCTWCMEKGKADTQGVFFIKH